MGEAHAGQDSHSGSVARAPWSLLKRLEGRPAELRQSGKHISNENEGRGDNIEITVKRPSLPRKVQVRQTGVAKIFMARGHHPELSQPHR